MTPLPLDDIRVLDLSQGIAGPLCARLLGDFGADVIKIEPVQGDCARRMPPFFADDPHPEKGLLFLALNLNKRGVTLDLGTDEGRANLRQLAAQADIIVESYPPGYLASLGLDLASLQKDHPALGMVSITPFGQTGPYAGFAGDEIVAYAMGGIMSISGTADREPLKHGGFQAQYEAGFNGALAAFFSLLQRDESGVGDHVDVSIQEVVASTQVIMQPMYSWNGGVQGRRRPTGSNFGNVMPCKDGYFIGQSSWTAGLPAWLRLADFFGSEALKEERFADPRQRIHNGAALDEILLDSAKDRTMAEMFKTASEQYKMLFGIVQTPQDLANCPQLAARDYFQEVEHPVIGRIKVPFRLFNLTGTPAQYRRCAPLLGEHNAEVYASL